MNCLTRMPEESTPTRRYLHTLAYLSLAFLPYRSHALSHCSHLEPSAPFVKAMLTDPASGTVERRVAFVIGNSAYQTYPLRTPVADATAVAERLQSLGFEVYFIINATQAETELCLNAVRGSLGGVTIALFYYAGHGVQRDDRNYIVAIDPDMDLGSHRGLIPIKKIVDVFGDSAQSCVIILDACRTWPAADVPAGLSVGAQVRAVAAPERGMGGIVAAHTERVPRVFQAYATSPNQTAADGTGKHSPFSEALLEYLGAAGESLDETMARVTNRVGERTRWVQLPWTRSSLATSLFLNGEHTLARAVAVSNQWAQTSTQHAANGRTQDAVAAALKGLPISISDTALRTSFGAAHDALYRALQQRPVVLDMGRAQVARASRDGRLVLTASLVTNRPQREVVVWDSTTGKKLLVVGHDSHRGGIVGWDLSDDGQTLATISWDGQVETWALPSGRLLRGWSAHPGESVSVSIKGSVAFGPSASYLVSVGDGSCVKLWETRSSRLVQTLTIGSASEPDLPDGEDAARWERVFDSDAPSDAALDAAMREITRHVWGKAMRRLDSSLTHPIISRDARFVAAATANTVILWDLGTGRLRHRLVGPSGWSVEDPGNPVWFGFDATGERILGYSGKAAWLWSTRTGQLLHEWQSDGTLLGASMSPDGDTIAIQNAAGWRYVSGETGREIQNPPVENTLATRVVYSPGGAPLGELEMPDFVAWKKGATGRDLMTIASETLTPEQTAEVARERVVYWPLASVHESGGRTRRR